jgi:hypothetical protein
MRVVKNVLDALHPGREINVLCFIAMQIRRPFFPELCSLSSIIEVGGEDLLTDPGLYSGNSLVSKWSLKHRTPQPSIQYQGNQKKKETKKKEKQRTYACPSSANMQSISLSRSNERS